MIFLSPSQCEHMLKNRPIHLKLESTLELKEQIKVVTANNVRNLLVPSDTFNVYPTIWPDNELGRIKEAGYIVTKEEYRQRHDLVEAEKKRLEEECELRKRKLKEFDKKREASQPEQKLGEQEGDDDAATRVLDRAFVAKQEQVTELFIKQI